MKLTLVVIAASLAGCAVQADFVHESVVPPAGEYAVCLKVSLLETLAESTAMCKTEFGINALACAEYPRVDGGAQRLITWRPVDFNDTATLTIIGHELVHSLGGTHK